MGFDWHSPLDASIKQTIARYAVQTRRELKSLDRDFFEHFANVTDFRELLIVLERYILERFDLMAEHLLFAAYSSDAGSVNPLYEEYLERVITEKIRPYVKGVLKGLRADLRHDVTSRLDLLLTAKKSKWIAEALRRKEEALRAESTPSPTAVLRKRAKNPELPPKSVDMTEIFLDSQLAPRQAEIASLAWERGMKRAPIARHLGLNWKTVDESLQRAKLRIDRTRSFGKAVRKRATHNPEKQK
jgi:hypothetical protein